MSPLPLLVSYNRPRYPFFFFFNDTATTEIYTLSLHDALPISAGLRAVSDTACRRALPKIHPRRALFLSIRSPSSGGSVGWSRSEEHTSELQSQSNLVCRLLLEKKNCSYVISPTRS